MPEWDAIVQRIKVFFFSKTQKKIAPIETKDTIEEKAIKIEII